MTCFMSVMTKTYDYDEKEVKYEMKAFLFPFTLRNMNIFEMTLALITFTTLLIAMMHVCKFYCCKMIYYKILLQLILSEICYTYIFT